MIDAVIDNIDALQGVCEDGQRAIILVELLRLQLRILRDDGMKSHLTESETGELVIKARGCALDLCGCVVFVLRDERLRTAPKETLFMAAAELMSADADIELAKKSP